MSVKVALACHNPPVDGSGAPFQLPNYGLRRIHAQILATPTLGAEVAIVELESISAEAYVARIAAHEPEVVGLACYVWSFATFFEVARCLRESLPRATIVLGGPSARRAMFDLPQCRGGERFVDALVEGEGELVFTELLASDRSPEALAAIPGLTVFRDGNWDCVPRAPLDVLDPLASPYQLGLMPEGGVGYLETYRGCPLSCTFCEWGIWAGGRFGEEALVAELSALKRARANPCFLLDAGLNLNTRAFKNLLRAEERAGYFRGAELIAELYPSRVNDDVLRFLDLCEVSYLGVGLQSLDPKVLARVDRPFDPRRFDEVIHAVTSRASVEVQIILGLPGDSPEGFRRTIEHVSKFPCDIRVYRCLVLPDALMTRSPPDFALDYDPHTLRMRSCLGWTAGALDSTCEWIDAIARERGGARGEFWWHVPGLHRSSPGRPAGRHVDDAQKPLAEQPPEQAHRGIDPRRLRVVD